MPRIQAPYFVSYARHDMRVVKDLLGQLAPSRGITGLRLQEMAGP